MNAEIMLAVLFGMIIGAWALVAGIWIYKKYDENRYKKRLTIEKLLREIEVRNILNQKMIEVLNRPITDADKEFINPTSDVKIPFYDYNFLKNYTSMYNLYIPAYYMTEFFKSLSYHLSVFDDEQDLKNGGYIFKDARTLMENFSVEITEDIEKKKEELNKAKNIYPSMLKQQHYEL
ncbi:hypothetical protein [Lactococcus termiticola]|uniref:Uncharacterized protein n=1 Tax=Lactococcus termiticola TaxID=2169526 RepID=A0A2R5HG13_9LACT|nr:hypothetical protein [Lactococcus termiticola]GBG96964.1 hypothetical protein NtB2_01100 [Lactococcus termiticola]